MKLLKSIIPILVVTCMFTACTGVRDPNEMLPVVTNMVAETPYIQTVNIDTEDGILSGVLILSHEIVKQVESSATYTNTKEDYYFEVDSTEYNGTLEDAYSNYNIVNTFEEIIRSNNIIIKSYKEVINAREYTVFSVVSLFDSNLIKETFKLDLAVYHDLIVELEGRLKEYDKTLSVKKVEGAKELFAPTETVDNPNKGKSEMSYMLNSNTGIIMKDSVIVNSDASGMVFYKDENTNFTVTKFNIKISDDKLFKNNFSEIKTGSKFIKIPAGATNHVSGSVINKTGDALSSINISFDGTFMLGVKRYYSALIVTDGTEGYTVVVQSKESISQSIKDSLFKIVSVDVGAGVASVENNEKVSDKYAKPVFAATGILFNINKPSKEYIESLYGGTSKYEGNKVSKNLFNNGVEWEIKLPYVVDCKVDGESSSKITVESADSTSNNFVVYEIIEDSNKEYKGRIREEDLYGFRSVVETVWGEERTSIEKNKFNVISQDTYVDKEIYTSEITYENYVTTSGKKSTKSIYVYIQYTGDNVYRVAKFISDGKNTEVNKLFKETFEVSVRK